MRIAAIASVLILGLATTGMAAAAQTPKRTSVTGKISVLKLKTITVNGKGKLTCRVTTTSPALRGLVLGTRAKIVCERGVLLTLKKLPRTSTLTTPVLTTPAPAPGSGGVVDEGTITVTPPEKTPVSPFSPGTPKTGLSAVGTSTITALGGGTIVFAGALSCTINASSPSTAAFRVGDRADYQCAGGVLTKLSTPID